MGKPHNVALVAVARELSGYEQKFVPLGIDRYQVWNIADHSYWELGA